MPRVSGRNNTNKEHELSNLILELEAIAKEVDIISSTASHENMEKLRIMYEQLEEGLPEATSGEVLSSRVKW